MSYSTSHMSYAIISYIGKTSFILVVLVEASIVYDHLDYHLKLRRRGKNKKRRIIFFFSSCHTKCTHKPYVDLNSLIH